MYYILSNDVNSNGIVWLRCSGQMFLMFAGLNKIGIFQMILYSTATESFAGGTISDAQENLPINCNTHILPITVSACSQYYASVETGDRKAYPIC